MFITFEGGEGTGKTTLIEQLKNELTSKGLNVITTREPGGSHVAEKIRKILLDNANTDITKETEALLFAASRAQHLNETIIPNLDKIILCDRYIDSSFAYQAFGRKLGMDFISKINSYALNYLPDITFYIDLDPNLGMKRIKNNRKDKTDRLDLETENFHYEVRKGYLEVAKMFEDRIIVIDGNQTIDAIYKIILENILERI